jgi:hypothetical protein
MAQRHYNSSRYVIRLFMRNETAHLFPSLSFLTAQRGRLLHYTPWNNSQHLNTRPPLLLTSFQSRRSVTSPKELITVVALRWFPLYAYALTLEAKQPLSRHWRLTTMNYMALLRRLCFVRHWSGYIGYDDSLTWYDVWRKWAASLLCSWRRSLLVCLQDVDVLEVYI